MSNRKSEPVDQQRRGLVLGGLAAMFMPNPAFSLTAAPSATTASTAATATAALNEYFTAIDTLHTLRRLQHMMTTSEAMSAQAVADSIIGGGSQFVPNSQFGLILRKLAAHNPDKQSLLEFLKPSQGSHIYELSFGDMPIEQAVDKLHRSITGGVKGLTSFVNETELRQKEAIRKAAQAQIDEAAAQTPKVSYPYFATNRHPIRAQEYDEAKDFYATCVTDKVNTGIPSLESCELVPHAAKHSTSAPYTQKDERSWQVRMQQEATTVPIVKTTRR